MNLILVLAFLFFVGSVSGWLLELLYRRFFSSANPERKWINPGFCTGPYLPLYGSGLCILFLMGSLAQAQLLPEALWGQALRFFFGGAGMTAIGYLAGIACLKIAKVRLWDYSDEWKNVNGIICPKFSLIWALLGAVYYFLIHPHILDALHWLSRNLAFSFFIGLFFGVFIIDVVNSAQLVVKLKRFAEENHVVVRYENLKAHIRSAQDKAAEKTSFLHPFHSVHPLNEHLKDMLAGLEARARKPKD